MKKLLVLGAALALGMLVGCMDDIEPTQILPFPEQLALDQELIDEYLIENSISTREDSVYGIRFTVHALGGAEKPALTDQVVVSYSGNIMGVATPFDKGDTVVFKLNQLIPAWQIVIPYIGEAGSVTMYVPSGYAYGRARVGPIPANSNLVFDVTLHNFLEE